MSATIIMAKEEVKGLIHHINNVDKEKGLLYRCVGCDKEMIVVKSEARKRDWHFRHNVESSCTGGRDTALHDYAVQILMGNASARLSRTMHIEYSNPQKEVTVFGKRSDVTVTFDNQDVHFEVFVTHDLDQEKIGMYKSNKIKCIRIDLSDPMLLTASPESIKEAVLNNYKNKTFVFWNEDVTVAETKRRNGFCSILLGVIAAIGIGYLFDKLFFHKRRR